MSASRTYWGRDLNVNIGHNNFDEIRYEYFRDFTVELEAFKGDQIDFSHREQRPVSGRPVTISRPSRKVAVKLEEFPVRNRGVMQGIRFQHPAREV